MPDKSIFGIDVSKASLDIACAEPPSHLCIPNTKEAIAEWLDQARPGLVAFEPTGGCQHALGQVLQERGVPFSRIHPNDVVAFRRARGIKAKTDAIDAGLIAAFVADQHARGQVRLTILPDDALRELAARRRQLVLALQAERQRLGQVSSQPVRASGEIIIKALADSLAAIEAALAQRITELPAAAALLKLLETVRGIGPVTAITLIADMPELGHLTAKQIASLAGLAPRTRQSGKSQFRATTGHGRASVKAMLFNAARAAIRDPGPMQDFYQRLVNTNRRPGKVAMVAVMRKLLVTANAIARDRTPWSHQMA